MALPKNETTKQYKLIFLTTFVFGLLAHGYRYFNSIYSHDSLAIVQDDGAWQISLGRFLQVPYVYLRGELTAPVIIGGLSLLFLGCALCVLANLLQLKNEALLIGVCALFATEPTLSISNASFINWSDIYMLALLLNVLAIWFTHKYKYGFIAGCIGIALGAALYQAYVCCAIALALLVLMQALLYGEQVGHIVRMAIRDFAVVLVGLILYAISNKIVQNFTGIQPSNSYNSVAGVGDFSGVSIPKLLLDTFLYPFSFFMEPMTAHTKWVLLAHLLLVAATVFFLIQIIRAGLLAMQKTALLAFLLLCFPLGINAVYFISKGFSHDLMRYAFVFSFLITVILYECCTRQAVFSSECGAKIQSVFEKGVLCLFAVICFCNVLFSNSVYLKKDTEYTATLSVVTRIIDRVEQVDGYVPAETPVIIIGTLDDSPLSEDRYGYEAYDHYSGMTSSYSVTYNSTISAYLKNVLGYPINVRTWENDKWIDRPEVQSMPCFPDKNSVQMIDGTVVVKLSDG